MTSASKSTLNLNNRKILRPKVTKNLTNLLKKFCEFRASCLTVTDLIPDYIDYIHGDC